MPGATPIGVLALIFTVLAFAQRLGGWEHKPTARVLLVGAGGLVVWWLTLVFPLWGAGICCGAGLIIFSIWFRGRPVLGKHPHGFWIGAIVPGLLLLLGSIAWAMFPYGGPKPTSSTVPKTTPNIATNRTTPPPPPEPKPVTQAPAAPSITRPRLELYASVSESGSDNANSKIVRIDPATQVVTEASPTTRTGRNYTGSLHLQIGMSLQTLSR
jgi:hypothetical protein